LCSQLESTDYKYLYQVLITIVIFLYDEFKDVLKNKKIFPKSEKPLSDFANIIKDNDGISKLKLIVETQKMILEKDRHNRESENLRIVAEEILIHAFSIETRSAKRQPSVEIMAHDQSLIDCLSCLKANANTVLFPCGHVVLCHKCALGALLKTYSGKLSECKRCKEKVNSQDVPWTFFENIPTMIVSLKYLQ